MERVLVVLLIGLLAAFLVHAQPQENEEELKGPRDMNVFVGRKGGAIRLYREEAPPPGKKGPRKTGQIEIKFGRIRETNGTDDDDGMPKPPGPPRPGIDNPDEVHFNVTQDKYVHAYITCIATESKAKTHFHCS